MYMLPRFCLYKFCNKNAMKSPTYSLHFAQLFHIILLVTESSSNEIRTTNWVPLFDFFFFANNHYLLIFSESTTFKQRFSKADKNNK